MATSVEYEQKILAVKCIWKSTSSLIEETLFPLYGHHGAQQFITENPICSVYTSFGYTLKFEPYQGAESRQASECACLGVGREIVIDIIFVI